MSLKIKLIIAAVIIVVLIAGCGIVSTMSFGSILLSLFSFLAGIGVGYGAKYIYDKYFMK